MDTDDPRIISREDAIGKGLKWFFTGKPCKRGHIYYRIAAKNYCVQCKNEAEVKRTGVGSIGRAAKLARHHRNRDKIREQEHARYLKNREQIKDSVKKWAKDNPEKVLSYSRIKRHKRRASQYGVGGSHTKQDIIDIFVSQSGKCAYCRKKITMNNKHIDHITAISKGGSNDRRNLQVLCGYCNRSKHTKDPIVFAQLLGMLL